MSPSLLALSALDEEMACVDGFGFSVGLVALSVDLEQVPSFGVCIKWSCRLQGGRNLAWMNDWVPGDSQGYF